MQGTRSVIPRLDVLEDRLVPATVIFNGNLTIINPSGNLTVTQVMVNNRFQVQDAVTNKTFSGVKQISILVNNGTHNTTVDLNSLNFAGTLSINHINGNGAMTVKGSGPLGGSLRGNLFLTSVFGSHTVSIPDPITINGGTIVSLGPLGNTQNVFTITGAATFNGPLRYTGGSGNDSVAMTNPGLTINGDTSIITGAGNDTVNLSAQFTVNGNLGLLEGNGFDLTTLNPTINGNLQILLGNGHDTVFMSPVGAPNGQFLLNTGNGNSSITITPTGGGSYWFVHFQFGNGSNTVTLGGAPGQMLAGTVFTSNPPGTLMQDDWGIIGPWVSNF